MDKKVGIITLDGYCNYGNRLQNYALQEVVKELGFAVDTLVIPRKERHPDYQKPSLVSRSYELLKNSPQDFIRRVNNKVFGGKHKRLFTERTNLFRKFSKEFLNERFCESTGVDLEKMGNEYDYLIVGSDQVWNPYNIKYAENAFFLAFANPQKRISYAASFGIENLPGEFLSMIKPWLLEMKALSVRETSGSEIIKRLTGKNAEVSLDPTLLLSKEKWLSIAKKGPQVNRKYILVYFLGEQTKELKKTIEEIANRFSLDIIDLANLPNNEFYLTGPREFIDYISSAELVFTDSFHGTAFSIILETPFYVLERIGTESMYSRIDTLLKKLNLKQRELNLAERPSKEIFEINFPDVLEKLIKERNKSFEYLAVALEIDALK